MVGGSAERRSPRWVEVSPSQYQHEADGLAVVRSLLPDNSPFRAWSCFEFRDHQGKWHEIDLLVLGRRRLHLVELKYYSGTLTGDDHLWLRDGHPAEDSPLKLARRNAQRLASKLHEELIRAAQETGAEHGNPRSIVPFVQEAVFLHHPDLRCELPAASRKDLFGPDEETQRTGLPGISSRLLEQAPPRQGAIGPNREEIIAALMKRIAGVRRRRVVGNWVIDEEPLGEGDGWQDWSASHKLAPTERVRIRILVTPPGAAAGAQATVLRIALHEFRIMIRLANDRLLRPAELVDTDLGPGLVYPLDERFQRLDLWLADHADQVSAADRLAILREVAEAVAYAHDNRVVHRGLTPHAVLIRSLPERKTRVLVGDWQSAGTVTGPPMTGLPSTGVTDLMKLTGLGEQAELLRQPMSPGAVDVDRQWAEAFQAPEGVWDADADRIRLDVFALGALAYFMMSDRPAAADRAAMQDRLRRQDGLDLAADLPHVAPAVRALVLEATRPTVSERLPDVPSFLGRLAAAEASLAGPAEDVVDPLEASPGAVIAGRFRLERRLGAGSTAVGLLVTDLRLTEASSAPAERDDLRVLKVALDDAAAVRLTDEARVLAGLDNPRLVRLAEGPVEIGGRQALVLENAADESLAAVLHRRGPVPLDLLQRWGADLLEALVALDRAGVSHRDIKPANLGVRKDPGDQADHLVLFDFSLTNAGSGAVTAGTPPYLDPFLDSAGRGRYDSAAERYSVAVVLYEMATGMTPRFGDGLSDPASVHHEAAIDTQIFDRARADGLAGFFRTALARDARQRYARAVDMQAGWRAVFAAAPAAPGRATGASAAPAAQTPSAGQPAGTQVALGLKLLAETEEIAQVIDSGARRANFVREGVLADIAAVVALVDLPRAERLARSLTADRGAALARVAVAVADPYPADAARLLGEAQQDASHIAQPARWHFPELMLVRRQILRAVGSRRTLVRVTRAVARSDPAAVTRLLEGARQLAMLDQDLQEELLAAMAVATVVVDAVGAEQTARGLTSAVMRAEALAGIASALASTDPASAERIARSLVRQPASRSASAGVSWAALALVTIAQAAAPDQRPRRRELLAQAEQLARAAGSDQALARIAAAVVGTDRAHALRLLAEAEQLARRRPDHQALIRVVTATAGIDLGAAEKVARNIAEKTVRALALSEIAVVTTRLDASRGAQLIAEAEQIARTGSDKLVGQPEALVRIAAAAAIADPARAELIARTIEDSSAESEAYGRPWAARALAAVAEAWFDVELRREPPA